MARRGMRNRPVNLSANVPQSFNVAGDFFHVYEAADPLEVSFDDSEFFEVAQGVGFRVIYERVTLRSVSSQAVRVFIGEGYVNDARASVAATITAPVEPAALNVDLPDVDVGFGAQEEIAPAHADQLSVVVSVPDDAANAVRVGGAGTDATHGVRLGPGMCATFDTRAALYAFNPAGSGTVTVTLTAMRSA